jgi:FtsH-binding integral membrane protein
MPPAEHVHWLFATGFLVFGLTLVAQGVVGEEVWRRRRWRAYLWPGMLFFLGLFMWPVMTFFTNSTMHMLAHSSWAQVMMLAGAAHLGLAHGKLRSRYWQLTMPLALAVSGAAFLIHEPDGWLFSRSAFVHNVCGWTLVVGAVFPLVRIFRPLRVLDLGYALAIVVLAVVLFTARDAAPIFGRYEAGGLTHR